MPIWSHTSTSLNMYTKIEIKKRSTCATKTICCCLSNISTLEIRLWDVTFSPVIDDPRLSQPVPQVPCPLHQRGGGPLGGVSDHRALCVRERHVLSIIVQSIRQRGDGRGRRHCGSGGGSGSGRGGGGSCQNRPP